jgi:hypothetical protein
MTFTEKQKLGQEKYPAEVKKANEAYSNETNYEPQGWYFVPMLGLFLFALLLRLVLQ